jgi:hypothetical protein
MNTLPNLTLTDPLAEETVRIVITVAPQAVPRPEKAILLSLSVTDQPPLMETGIFGQIPDLIQQLWTQFGVRQQAVPISTNPPDGEPEVLAEMDVTSDNTPSVTPSPLPTPKPQPKNLTLF